MDQRWWRVLVVAAATACGGGSSGDADGTSCTTSSECVGDPGGPACDVDLGACVACTAAEDVCAVGSHCVDDACVAGCGDTTDCAAGTVCDVDLGVCVACVVDDDCAGGTVCDAQVCRVGCRDSDECASHACDPTSRVCVDCLVDGDCAAGTVCAADQTCVPGCTDLHPCEPGLGCCDGACTDLMADPTHCQTCETACVVPANAPAICDLGMCGMGECDGAWLNCDGDIGNGCEHDGAALGPCVCTPTASEACYEGAPETLGVGVCVAGAHVCDASGTAYGTCDDQVLPVLEVCDNGLDDDCNGGVDDPIDADGDGWTYCAGDCDDANPLVNRGAFEIAGDGLDNDCDDTIDNPVTTACSTAAKFTGVTASNQAAALDLCQTTTANPPIVNKIWGLISAAYVHANGTVPAAAAAFDIQNKQSSVMTAFGTGGIVPTANATLGGLSTGMSRDANDAGWVAPIAGTEFTPAIAFPGAGPLADYLAQHSGTLDSGTCGDVVCPAGTGANDSLALRLELRVPTNAVGFSYDFRLLSSEYQTYQCTTFNDYFLASLYSGADGLPADHNISTDADGRGISINSPFVSVCGGNGKNCNLCPDGTGPLAGTGYDQVNGGGTAWLTTDAPVVPGEIITVYFSLFDVQDHIYDTQILLDNFRWQFAPVTLSTHPA